MLWCTVAVLAGGTVFTAIAIGEVVIADCARAASEINDPCAIGRTAYAGWVLLVWAAVSLPLCYLAGALWKRIRADRA